VEDLCKPHPIANVPNFEPKPAPEVRVRAGDVILHLLIVNNYKIFDQNIVNARGEHSASDDRYNTPQLSAPGVGCTAQYGFALNTKFTAAG